MMTCIAIDDEPLALSLLEDNIRKIPFLNLIGKYDDPFQAVGLLNEGNVDLVFIDIQMPGINGLKFLGSLNVKPLAIVVTAYNQYALESYEFNVVDYLVKPVEMDRFMKACNKSLEIHLLRSTDQANNLKKYIFLNVGYSLQKVIFDDIIYIEGLKEYIKIHLKSSKNPLLVRMSMKAIEADLPQNNFVRIHKSFIVSVDEITALRKNSIFLGELELGIGDTYSHVLDQLKK
jgi:two-component system, LytTR family, response regulator